MPPVPLKNTQSPSPAGKAGLLLLLESHGHPRSGGVGRQCYQAEPTRNCSEQEGDNGHAQGWVVTELLQVAAMLAFGPDSHLGEAHQGEEGHCGQNGVSE